MVAFICDCFASFFIASAYIAMKKGFIRVENSGLNGSKRLNPYYTCEWIFGFFILITGSFIHVAVLPFADLVILSTGSAIATVLNTLMAVFYLGEKSLLSYDIPALTMIVGGSLAIVGLSDYSDTTYTPESIEDLLISSGTMIFMLLYLLVAFFTFLQYQWHLK